MAAGTMTLTESGTGTVKKIRAAWTAGTAGEAGTASAETSEVYDGKVITLVTDPAAGGTQPDDNYDVVALDGDGDDVLAGAGADRDETNTEVVTEPNLGAVAGSKLTISVSGAGASNEGVVILTVR